MWRSSATKRAIPSPPSSPEPSSPEQSPQTTYRRRPPLTPRSTLSEALKGNPFKSASAPALIDHPPVPEPDDDPVQQLNQDLETFANVYPDVKVEVLRELLLRFDGDSRLQICIEQLLRYKSEWSRGRLLNPPREPGSKISVEEQFRSSTYVAASRRTLNVEFKSLNKSTIDAVLAEVNQSYSKARPILQGIASKSWRAAFSSFFKKKKASNEAPSFLVDRTRSEYTLQPTGDSEIDQELDQLFFAGPKLHGRKAQERADGELAFALNQQEAEEANALFECQVCYNDVPFEFIVTCTQFAHAICCDCIRRSLNEALFGQGWAKSVHVAYGSLRCIASDANGECDGHISSNLLQPVILSFESGYETWLKFEQRLATDNMLKSSLPLTQCVFCHYAETPQVYDSSTALHIKWQFRKQQVSLSIIFLILIAEFILPTVLLVMVIVTIISPGLPRQVFHTSLVNVHRLVQTPRFQCKNPGCSRVSCLACSKPWYDPHTCHEPLILSLRTAVEAARTAALKRTCPRCGMSFVKSSGCNKLTCVCGYAMCYLCRKNIGKVNDHGAVDEREGGEGYRHFCEHFRPTPGQKCTECNKCDLYMTEDEEMLVKKAGEAAEKEWREREGMVGVKGLGLEEAVGSLGKLGKDDALTGAWNRFVTGDWTVQNVCDWAVDRLIIVES